MCLEIIYLLYRYKKYLALNILQWLICHKTIFTNPSTRAEYDTRSFFKRSLTGLNSEFSFSWTSCLTKAEKPSLLYYLPIARVRIIWFISFPRVLVLCNQLRAGFELVLPYPFPTTITITPRVRPIHKTKSNQAFLKTHILLQKDKNDITKRQERIDTRYSQSINNGMEFIPVDWIWGFNSKKAYRQ